MIKRLIMLSALAVGTASFAHADTINGAFTATNSYDQFTSSSVTFVGPAAGGGLGTVDGNVGGASTATGTFLTYFGANGGQSITYFPAFPTQTPLPYVQGANPVPPAIYAPGQTGVELFTVTGGGETFNFYMKSYNALYSQNTTGCTGGDTCLSVTGLGYFTATGVDSNFGNQNATFQFTSSYTPDQGATTTFQANAGTVAATPEPASLMLLGTGMLGAVGVARRRFLKA